jgi:hypothetical protein
MDEGSAAEGGGTGETPVTPAESAGQEGAPLDRYFAMPAGGWPDQVPTTPDATTTPGPTATPSVSSNPLAGTSWPPPPPPPPPGPVVPGSGDPYQGATAPSPRHSSTGRHRLRLGVIVVALLLVAGGVIGGIVSTASGPPTPGAGESPANFVVSSTQTTLSQHSADITISGTLGAAGQTIPVSGTGAANFDTNAFQANLSFAKGSSSFEEQELVADGQLYFGLTVDGQNMSAVTGGPEWINVPVPDQDASSLGAGNVDPLDQLKLLEQKGATVTPEGTSTIDGATVSGYSVTFSPAELQHASQQELQTLGLPQSDGQKIIDELGSADLHLYFDGGGLLRRESVSLGGGSSTVSGDVQFDFANYGTSVNIQPPASNDVIGFSQFEKEAQALSTSQSG